jgi:hypothetical protein
MASVTPGQLYPAVLAMGLAYGAQWSMMPALASELFGLTHFAMNYGVLQVGAEPPARTVTTVTRTCPVQLLVTVLANMKPAPLAPPGFLCGAGCTP